MNYIIMSASGGTFTLITNDGRADQLLTSYDELKDNIGKIQMSKKIQGGDPTIRIEDIEDSHIVWMSAEYKSYIPIGFEYQKITPQGGGQSLFNVTMQFSLPQFGDFFHDIVTRTVLGSVYSSELTAPTKNSSETGFGGTKIVYPDDGKDWDNSTELEGSTYSLVDPFGNAVAASGKYRNLVKYCEYPGERLFKKVVFTVNGNILDEYYSDNSIFHREFNINSDKKESYKRLVGQETPVYGTGPLRKTTVVDAHKTNPADQEALTTPTAASPTMKTPAEFTKQAFPKNSVDSTIADNTTDVGPAHSADIVDIHRSRIANLNGPQTPKYQQPKLELWNPLLFWFCKDVRVAVPSVSIPYGQRFIHIHTCNSTDLIKEEPGLYIKQVVTTTKSRTTKYRPYHKPGNISSLSLQVAEMYVNNLFVTPEIHNIYVQQSGVTLIRIHKMQKQQTTSPEAQLHLSTCKFPTETISVGFKPSFNEDTAINPNWDTEWHKHNKIMYAEDPNTVSVDVDIEATPAAAHVPQYTSTTDSITKSVYPIQSNIVNKIAIDAHGTALRSEVSQTFCNKYIPFQYGGTNLTSPTDTGLYMHTFSLYPGSYQPSGHINLSRAREVYVKWKSNYISATTPVSVVIVAQSINWLMVTDGSAILRFST